MLQLLDLARENAGLKCELNRRRGEMAVLQRLLAAVHETWSGRTCASGESCGAAARLDALQRAMPISSRIGREYG